ncbi:MAG: SurA N-terminal domain-containing protein [Pyrinomonadaceae bacterium]|nr:SurA N-terminal domain-containing protein [Pyrinomonadaceae bacterium]
MSRNEIKSGRLTRCLLVSLLLLLSASSSQAQEVVDKMVATVNGGVRTDLITYSDLLWQMALQPNTPVDNPNSEALNRALQLIINQRLIYQEAEKLPTINPTDKEISDALAALISLFPSRADFMERVQRVGLTSEQLREIIRQRVAIDKYLDFRFRSFTVITPKEVSDYYRDVYTPRFQRQYPGRIVPTFEQVSKQLEAQLTEDKIESETTSFLDTARERAEITILNPV